MLWNTTAEINFYFQNNLVATLCTLVNKLSGASAGASDLKC